MNYLKFFIILMLLTVVFPAKAYAYIDPGTGSYLFQLLIATAVGSLFAIKMFWVNIKTFFSKLFGKKQLEDKKSDKPE